MQIYSAIFPVKESLSQDDLINLVIEWNQRSPHNKISNLNWDGKKRNIKFEEENLSLSIEEIRTYNTIAIRFHQFDENNIIWNTDIVVNFNTHASLMLLGALMISIRCPKTSPLLLSAYRLSKVFCMS